MQEILFLSKWDNPVLVYVLLISYNYNQSGVHQLLLNLSDSFEFSFYFIEEIWEMFCLSKIVCLHSYFNFWIKIWISWKDKD